MPPQQPHYLDEEEYSTISHTLQKEHTGNGFCAFRDGVLGQLAGKDQPDGGLNFARGDCGFLVIGGELGGLSGDTFKDIVDEGVED